MSVSLGTCCFCLKNNGMKSFGSNLWLHTVKGSFYEWDGVKAHAEIILENVLSWDSDGRQLIAILRDFKITVVAGQAMIWDKTEWIKLDTNGKRVTSAIQNFDNSGFCLGVEVIEATDLPQLQMWK